MRAPSIVDANRVLWRWQERGGHRVAILSGPTFVVSGVLDNDQVRAFELARTPRSLESVEFGRHSFALDLVRVASVSWVPERSVVTLELHDGRTSYSVSPTDPDIAGAMFAELRRRHSLGEPVRATEVDPGPVVDLRPSHRVRLAAGFGVVGVASLLATSSFGQVIGFMVWVAAVVFLLLALVVTLRHLTEVREVETDQRRSYSEIRVRLNCSAPLPPPRRLPADALDIHVAPGDADPLADLLDPQPGT